MRTPSPSIFRPEGGVDQRALKEHKALIEEIDRRKILRGAVSLQVSLPSAGSIAEGPA